MAGLIVADDIEEVKRRINLADLIGDYVTLKTAGVDSLKGLCPFHDERSPSFHVRPSAGYYHCFGCGESGDAIKFLQTIDHVTFTEAVERLAARCGMQLRYQEGGERKQEGPSKSRLLAANQAAAEFYVQQLATPEGVAARDFMAERGFDAQALAHFGVGYAPRGWDGLRSHLIGRGFTPQELLQAGLMSESQKGGYDRFRGRIIWPIRDTSGQVLGFGARKLYEDDQGPKYLNTPDSPVYHKSRVLYGIDLAKRTISQQKRAVVVEGYTDVMACHLAGETAAVATCGTAFGREHISILRRIMGDDAHGEVIFTFDPDEAGQKAAMRAFADEKRFTAQTYVAVGTEGFDPADLRLHRGDEAVRQMFSQRAPLFEFALQQAVKPFDLNTVEGRLGALRAGAPIVAGMRDAALRPGYTRELARLIGCEMGDAEAAVRQAVQAQGQRSRGSAGGRRGVSAVPVVQSAPGMNVGAAGPALQGQVGGHFGGGAASASGQSDQEKAKAPQPQQFRIQQLPNTAQVRLEKEVLAVILQVPQLVGEGLLTQVVTAEFQHPALRAVRDATAQTLPQFVSAGNYGGAWVAQVAAAVHPELVMLVHDLAAAPLPTHHAERVGEYAVGIVSALLERDLLDLKRQLQARLARLGDSDPEAARRVNEKLVLLEQARRSLRQE